MSRRRGDDYPCICTVCWCDQPAKKDHYLCAGCDHICAEEERLIEHFRRLRSEGALSPAAAGTRRAGWERDRWERDGEK